MDIVQNVLLRKPIKDDENFIFSSYLKSFRCSSDNLRMDNDVYFFNFKRIIEHLVAKNNISILCDVADHNLVIGYCIHDTRNDDVTVIHYIYVRYTFRKLGMARILFQAATKGNKVTVATHCNRVLDDIRRNPNYCDIQYNPFLRNI